MSVSEKCIRRTCCLLERYRLLMGTLTGTMRLRRTRSSRKSIRVRRRIVYAYSFAFRVKHLRLICIFFRNGEYPFVLLGLLLFCPCQPVSIVTFSSFSDSNECYAVYAAATCRRGTCRFLRRNGAETRVPIPREAWHILGRFAGRL